MGSNSVEQTSAALMELRSKFAAGATVWEERVPGFDVMTLGTAAPVAGYSVRESNEGTFSKVDNGGSAGDFSRTGQDFDFHSDGLYHDPLPQLVGLYCVDPGRSGSVTRLSDGAAAVSSLSERAREIGCMLSCVYIGRHGQDFSHPLFVEHPDTGALTVHMASRGYLRPTNLIPSAGDHLTVRDIASFTNELLAALEGHVVVQKEWERGDLLCFDNLMHPHARRSDGGQADPERLLHRFWLDRN